jgi:hypothetical protein
MLNYLKRSLPFLLILLFIGFLFLGYAIAKKFFPGNSPKPVEIPSIENEVLSQSGYLLFQVSSLEQKDAQLISTWILIDAATTTGHQMFFVNIYPVTDLTKSEQLNSIFSLTRDEALTNSSFRRYKRLIDLPLNGYFIIDNSGLLSLASIAGIDQMEIHNESPQSVETVQHIQASGEIFLSRICEFLTSGAGTSFFSQLNLDVLMPDVITSDRTKDEISALVNDVIQSTSPYSCNVIVP